jgi:hypothetical protein
MYLDQKKDIWDEEYDVEFQLAMKKMEEDDADLLSIESILDL